jgi:hypothetical protein
MNGFLAWIPAVSVGYFAARANPDLRADRSCLRRHPPPGRAALSPGQHPLGGKRRPIMYAAIAAQPMWAPQSAGPLSHRVMMLNRYGARRPA